MKAWQDPIGTIRDICPGDPDESYHPDIAKLYATDVPDDAVNGATLVAGVWTNPPPPPAPVPPTAAEIAAVAAAALAVVKTTLVKQIDAAVLAVYDRPMSLSKEYESREKAAADYRAAGYAGTVPARLAGFATPAGMTPTQAADLVLSQSAQMRGALDSLGDLRMRKYEVQRATTEAAARTVHTDIMAQIAAIASALG